MSWKVPTFKLLSGHNIPLLGLGSYLIDGEKQTREVLDRALTAGFRLIDTAAMYGNEQEIGLALKHLLPKHDLKREDVFITSKLYPSDHGDKAKDALAKSLKKLDCQYMDLYLIHWPGVYGVASKSPDNAKLRAASWASLVKAKEEGLVRDLGVSNYTVRHLTELLDDCHGVKPVLNQIEWHPACHQDEIKELCENEGILLQAYMPLGSGNQSLLTDTNVIKIAQKLNKEPAQVLLRWSIQQNVAVIPKARSKEHLETNINLDFVIPDDDMIVLSTKIKHQRFDWNPNSIK